MKDFGLIYGVQDETPLFLAVNVLFRVTLEELINKRFHVHFK